MKKRIVTLLLAATMAASLIVPQSVFAEGEGITVVAGSQADPGTAEPYYTSGVKMTWLNMVYQTFGTRKGLGGEMELVLAKSTEQVDGKTLNVEIYDNIYDSEGNHMTADDVVFCYQWMKDSGTVSKMGNLESIEKTGDYTVTLHFTADTVGVVEDMMEKPIVTKAAYEAAGEDMSQVTVGTGPYVIDELVDGSSVTLKRRDDYWKTENLSSNETANVETVTINYIASTNQLAIALENNEIDGIMYMSGKDVSNFINDDGSAKDGYFVETWKDPNVYQLFCNMSEDSILSGNKELREAIFTAIDTQALVEAALDGKGSTTHDYASDLYPEYGADWDSEPYYDFDTEKAASMAAESGYNGEELVLATYNASPYKEMAEIMQAYLEMAGIKVSIYPFESTQRDEMLKATGDWDLMMFQTLSMDYIVNCYTYMLNADNWGGETANHYVNDEFQELLKAATNAETHSDETVDAVHDFMVDEAFARGLVVNNFYSIWHEGVSELYFTRNNYPQIGSCSFTEDWHSVAD